MRWIALLLGLGIILGCDQPRKETVSVTTIRETAPVSPPPPQPPRPVTIDDIILEIQKAPDGPTQATALNRLHSWMSARQLLYTTRVENANTGELVSAGASTLAVPLRVSVSITNQGQPFRDFGFNSRDNRNLVVLGIR